VQEKSCTPFQEPNVEEETPLKSKKTPSMKSFSKKFIDREIRSFKKQDWLKRKDAEQKRTQQRSQSINIDTRPRITIVANRFGFLCAFPAKDADGFVKMGTSTEMEDGMTGAFMAALDFADNVSLKYEQATRYLIRQS
jgi:hypothetical protein